jgi:hypothetical protein
MQGRLSKQPYLVGRALKALPRMLARPESKTVPRSKPTQKQRRLKPIEVDQLVQAYTDGSTAQQVADAFRVSRDTVLLHLERRGIPRRAFVRKLTDADVSRAANVYLDEGLSLLHVGALFQVDPTTMRREFARAGVPIRPRRGYASEFCP